MGRQKKLLDAILGGSSDTNIGFRQLCSLLRHLGFEENVRVSHHTFWHPRVVERINVQRAGSKAKRYQIRQVRRILVRYGLRVREED